MPAAKTAAKKEKAVAETKATSSSKKAKGADTDGETPSKKAKRADAAGETSSKKAKAKGEDAAGDAANLKADKPWYNDMQPANIACPKDLSHEPLAGASWVIFKVPPGFEWLSALDGATLQLPPSSRGPVQEQTVSEVAKLKQTSADEKHGQVLDDVTGGHQLMAADGTQMNIEADRNEGTGLVPLLPSRPGSHTLDVAGQAFSVVRVLPEVASPLSSTTASPGKKDGTGSNSRSSRSRGRTVPLKTINLSEAESMILMSLPSGQTIDLHQQTDSDVKPEVKCLEYAGGKKGKIRRYVCVSFADAPEFKLLGQKNEDKAEKMPWGLRYLIGVLPSEGRRMFVCKAEMYSMWVDWKRRDQEEASNRKLTWEESLEKRLAAVSGFGTEKKRKQAEKITRMRDRAGRVFDEAQSMQYLDKRAQVVSSEQEVDRGLVHMELRRRFLPPFDDRTYDPKIIYKAGLKTIAPPEMTAKEASIQGTPEMSRHFLEEAMAAKDLVKAFGSETAAMAASRVREKGLRAKSKAEASAMAQRCLVLHKLIVMWKATRRKGGLLDLRKLAEALEMDISSPLAMHWHQTYFEPVPDKKNERQVDSKKLLCHMAVWALYLSPDVCIDTTPMKNDLGMQPDALRSVFEYVGCSVSKSDVAKRMGEGSSCVVRLIAPLKLAVPQGGRPKKRPRT